MRCSHSRPRRSGYTPWPDQETSSLRYPMPSVYSGSIDRLETVASQNVKKTRRLAASWVGIAVFGRACGDKAEFREHMSGGRVVREMIGQELPGLKDTESKR